jgi:DNA-binding XRE family transcriptional regulator
MLAELVDVPYQTILAWNQGRSMPKMGMLLELLKVLNVRFEDLLDASLYQRKF